MKGLLLPESIREEMVFLDVAEMRRFIGLTPQQWRPLVALVFFSGLRFGDATAPTVADVDFDRATLPIPQAWKDTADVGHVLGPPKSKRARRTIPLPQSVSGAPREATLGRGPGEFVLTNSQVGHRWIRWERDGEGQAAADPRLPAYVGQRWRSRRARR